MLRTLRIRNLAIVEDLTAEFGPGLNLLTGETGAGKSILIDALGLARGARADRSVVRSGAERAVVEASFDLGNRPGIRAWMEDHGMDADDGTVVVRREVPSASGSSRVFVNGSPCTLAVLRELGGMLLELHGQHEQQSLTSAERQLMLLDRYGGHHEALGAVESACREVVAARDAVALLEERAAGREQRREGLERAVREIDGAAPAAGELERLATERRVLRSSGRMLELLGEAVDRTYEGEVTAAGLASAAAAGVEELAELDPSLSGFAERLRAAAVEVQDIGAALREYRDATDFDPTRLDEVEARRVMLERLCERHATDEAGLLDVAREAADELAGLDGMDGEIRCAGIRAEEAAGAYVRAAEALTGARERAAKRMAAALREQFEAVALRGAGFDVSISARSGDVVEVDGAGRLALHPRGAERVEFLLAANPGEPLRPLAQVASGGELSRVMLALYVVARGGGEPAVLVFDEVDAGVGGTVADAVGARMAAIARRHQVLCVTHLPQVAAHADHHLRVGKSVTGGRTRSEIEPLDASARKEELARMLAGRRPTDTSRRHAGELLEAAGRAREVAGD